MNKINCRSCGELKVRILDPRPSWTDRTVDESGKVWGGRTCPQCKTQAIQKKMTKRLCRRCNKPLPPSHYYFHPHCQSKRWRNHVETEYIHYV